MNASAHHLHAPHTAGLNRIAAAATLHCLTGCAIGEVTGLVVGTALGFSNAATIALAVSLAFVFGYALTMIPLVRSGLTIGAALPIAFASDSFSIAVMEIVDNGVMLAVPGAMDAPLTNSLFWGALAFAFAVAYVFAFPVNRYLIARGRGHAVVHAYHTHGGAAHDGDAAPRTTAHEGHQTVTGSPRRLIVIGAAAMAATIGVATGGALVVESRGHSENEVAAAGDGEMGAHAEGGAEATRTLSGLSVAAAGYRLEVAATELRPGRTTPFSFAVVDDRGPVRRFDEEGGVRMHLIVVRRDLTGYQHLHPTLQPDGSWRTPLTLAEPGVYRAYADFERGGEKTVLATDLFVGGAFDPAPLPAPTRGVDVAGYRVELTSRPEAGAEATLAYSLARDEKPVDVEPYLGAAGHLVALREGDLAYLHVHPLSEKRGAVRFAATFPTAGRYRLFLQFKDAGRVRTAPLTVSVESGR